MAQVWLVTGSSRGLGRAIVEAGLLAGNKVLATARDIESLRELSERYGDQVKLFELDVTDESSAAGAVIEAAQLGHGFLTYALVEEGLKQNAADFEPKDGVIVAREWLDYATERVPQMQADRMREGRTLVHEIAFVDGEEKIQDLEKRSVQQPRVFYRRELDQKPWIVSKEP